MLDKLAGAGYNISMEQFIIGQLKFEWDDSKNEINMYKHNVSFEEAATVFDDDNAIILDDPDHSTYEQRFIILGFSTEGNLLMVCHCERHNADVIRLISARKATKPEQKQYFNRR